MSDELKKAYKVIQPVVHGVRREVGEVLELTAEEAEHLAAFIAPADEAAQNTGTDENSEQQSSDSSQTADESQGSDQQEKA